MAHSQSLTAPESAPVLDKLDRQILAGLAAGLSPPEIAKRLAVKNGKTPKQYRALIRKRIERHEHLRLAIGEVAHAEAAIALIPAIRALGRRAGRGNVNAIKLLAEITGFHNPRDSTTTHQGEITINLAGIPRPRQLEGGPGTEVIDAEVVEE